MPGLAVGAPPLYGQYASVAALKTGLADTPGAGTGPLDVIDIRANLPTGTFTAAADDVFALRNLYQAAPPTGGSVAAYKVALRNDRDGANAGKLLLDGADVTGRDTFTPQEFSKLQLQAGPAGTRQDLVVVAQSGKRAASGTLTDLIDSPATALTALVTGKRSLNALSALITRPTGDDAAFIGVAQDAGIFTGFGAPRPALSTAGNFTAAAGDTFALRDLYQAKAPPGGQIAQYKVAFRAGQPGAGRLELDDADVSDRQSFTPAEFGRLHFTAGPEGSTQDLVVVAQTGKRGSDGTLTGIVDSPAVQVNAAVTGTRSINAVSALLTQPAGNDAGFLAVAQESGIFNGFGAPRPTLGTVGNIETKAGDLYALRDLYQATPPAGAAIAGYRIALRDPAASRLLLGDTDVTSRTSFTPEEFSRLHYQAGPDGSVQDLVVVAQTGKRGSDGTLTAIIDSPAVQITAAVTGRRSINAASALLTPPGGADSAFVAVAQQATIFGGYGAPRPGLTTVGNLNAAPDDLFAIRNLYQATPPPGGSIAGYKVAVRNGGALLLDQADVTDRTDFTAAEFSRLQVRAGASGSRTDLLVLAQTGVRKPDGTLANVINSPAIQLGIAATGTRSINAAAALLTQPTGSDAAFIRTAQESAIFNGFGATRPGLSTTGNFAAVADDLFSLRNLFQATGAAAGYKVALRATGGGTLVLGEKDVTDRISFSAAEFSQLQFRAGPAGSSADLLVIAQSGIRATNGTLTNVVDSPAVQITAAVTGRRSINAVNALLTAPTGADAAFLRVAQEAGIFTGFGASRPTISTGNIRYEPQAMAALLTGVVGAFYSTDRANASPINVFNGIADAVGSNQGAAGAAQDRTRAVAAWAQNATDEGGFQVAGTLALQRFAIAAYAANQRG